MVLQANIFDKKIHVFTTNRNITTTWWEVRMTVYSKYQILWDEEYMKLIPDF
jgi:hypothetical protein